MATKTKLKDCEQGLQQHEQVGTFGMMICKRIQVKNIHGPVLSNINLTLYVYMDISWNIWLEFNN